MARKRGGPKRGRSEASSGVTITQIIDSTGHGVPNVLSATFRHRRRRAASRHVPGGGACRASLEAASDANITYGRLEEIECDGIRRLPRTV